MTVHVRPEQALDNGTSVTHFCQHTGQLSDLPIDIPDFLPDLQNQVILLWLAFLKL